MAFCFKHEPNRLAGVHGQNFAFIHNDFAVDGLLGYRPVIIHIHSDGNAVGFLQKISQLARPEA